MKKLLLVLCIAIFGIMACKKKDETPTMVAPVAPKEKTTLIMGLDDSFPPMGFRDENNQIVGFDVDLAKEVAKRLKLELVLQPIDWASKELELNNNKIDVIWNGLSVDPARAEAMLLSKPYLTNSMVIVVKKDSPMVAKETLKSKSIGVQTGSTAVKSYEKDELSKTATLIQYENNVLALSDLKIGRIDAVVMDEVVAKYLITKSNEPFKILKDKLDTEMYAIAFKKDNTVFAEKVAGVLAEMAADGTSDNISMKWFGEAVVLK